MKLNSLVIAGVDEVGRGPLAGPVIAAAVILDPARPIAGLVDSKKITAKKREALDILIKNNALAYAIGRADVHEIDQYNILQATFLAMQRAIAQLAIQPDEIWIDGNQAPAFNATTRTFVKGDQRFAEISAASIIAKVARDREMDELHKQYPHYGFANHKGYGTVEHLNAIWQHGPSDIHRKSFAPIKHYYSSKAT